MKRIFFYVAMALVVVGMSSCSQKHDKTIADLKAAIDGESTASAKYAAFADKAAKDSLYNIEVLFRATSEAEAIHIKNHQAALTALGVTDYKANVKEYEVKSTAENLQAAIDGETYEFTEMYPGFIKDAESEKSQEAIVSLNYAQDAEKGHAKLYADALAKIATPGALAAVYYVCPKCGNTFANTPPEVCELCQTPSSQFIAFNAVMPLSGSVDTGSGATAQPVK